MRLARRTALGLALLATLSSLTTRSADAAPQEECNRQRLSPPWATGTYGSRAVRLGDRLVVADPGRWFGNTNSAGVLQVYERQAGLWQHEELVWSGDLFANQYFGYCLRSDGRRLFATCVANSPALAPPIQSSVAVLEKIAGTWTAVDYLYDTQSPYSNLSHLGWRFELDGDRLVAGTSKGFVEFLETPGGWTEVDRFELGTDLPASMLANLPFATPYVADIKLQPGQGRMLLTTPGGLIALERQAGGWTPVQFVQLPGVQYGRFVIAWDGDWAAIGVSNAPNHLNVRIYHHDGIGWSITQALDATGTTYHPLMGSALSLRGDRLLVGNPGAPVGGLLQVGEVLVYGLSPLGHWDHLETLRPQDTIVLRKWGSSVELNAEGDALVGCSDATSWSSSPWPGALDVVRLATPMGVPFAEPPPNSTGLPARLRARGSTTRDHDALRFTVDRLPPASLGVMLFGNAPTFPAALPGGGGSLALAPPFQRWTATLGTSSGNGRVDLAPSLLALPSASLPGAGETWTFQYWTRDVPPAAPSSTSNALAITFESLGPATVQFPASVRVENESTTLLQVPVTLSQPLGVDVAVPFTVGGSATHLVDWRVELASPLVIPAGATEFLLPVVLADDPAQEGAELATITLGTPPAGAALGTQATWTLLIDDDD